MIRKLSPLIVFLVACNDSQARQPDESARDVRAPQVAHPVTGSTMKLEQVGGTFQKPVYLTAPAGDQRLFVVEQAGRIRIVKNGAAVSTPFLDIADRVKSGGEQGLLSIAFDPAYATNGFFYVNFTDRRGDTNVERFKVSVNPDVADPASAKLLLKIEQPYSNHNGGHVMFGPDGMLWIGTGDGGSGGDPRGNGQNKNSLLGKMLRIDVRSGSPYAIPRENPWPDGRGGKAEIWAYGLRNPWRFAFDRTSSLVYIADVGQGEWEEVHIEPATRAGLNYGWNIMEGSECFRDDNCSRAGLQIPQVTYNHVGAACSITGGFVYRGRALPTIAGHYFYSDYCAGWLRSFIYSDGKVSDRHEWTMDRIGHIVSFGEDAAGELYIVAEDGRIFRFAGVS